ncbi:MAG TPA: DnaJ domain-containing protein [Methyloceanibacter sp.]|jgi:hypothetical protein|nr:DnaJ domain-containing protein [Methyloceanibacter sp.]
MPYFLAGLALLVLLILLARAFTRANPQALATTMRKTFGGLALAAAAFLFLRGAIPLAIPLGVFGLALLGKGVPGFGNPFGGADKSPGQTSKVRTTALEMELDHDTGRMDGQVLAGRFAGRTLSSLSEAEVIALVDELRGGDVQDLSLMEAYLQWRMPEWREEATKAEARSQRRRRGASAMSADEAREVLGVPPGAKAEDIRKAHRNLMKRMHPDQGGTNYLAARINEAKDVLLGRA